MRRLVFTISAILFLSDVIAGQSPDRSYTLRNVIKYGYDSAGNRSIVLPTTLSEERAVEDSVNLLAGFSQPVDSALRLKRLEHHSLRFMSYRIENVPFVAEWSLNNNINRKIFITSL